MGENPQPGPLESHAKQENTCEKNVDRTTPFFIFFWGDSETTEVNYQAADMLIRDQHFFESFRGGCNIQKLKRGRWVII